MSCWLRAFLALAEDPGFVSRPHMVAHTIPNSSHRWPSALFRPPQAQSGHTYRQAKHSYTQNKHIDLKQQDWEDGSAGKGLATKPDGLRLILGTQVVAEENQLPQAILRSPVYSMVRAQ